MCQPVKSVLVRVSQSVHRLEIVVLSILSAANKIEVVVIVAMIKSVQRFGPLYIVHWTDRPALKLALIDWLNIK